MLEFTTLGNHGPRQKLDHCALHCAACRILDAVYPEYVLHLSADEFEDAWYAHDLEIAALGPLLYQG